MIVGIGVDLLHLARLRSLLARRQPHQFASKILSRPELLEWEQSCLQENSVVMERYLALRWTAKEAAYKALYPHMKLTWKDLVVTKQDKKPRIDFSPAFLETLDTASNDLRMHLSVSHDGDMMIAYVVVEQG
ncbi:holo-ACP synthase [Sporobolomyces salmoneus]|uniref:holo-ACP synthase n=1 Tax=Sporobolomyces salmoneus TaxID=183962 RepID=UPI0031721C87